MMNIFSHDSSSVSLQRAACLYSGMDQQPVCSPLNKILDVSVISYIIEHMFIYIPVELFAVPCLVPASADEIRKITLRLMLKKHM